MQLHSRLRLPTLALCAATLCVVCSGCHFGGEQTIWAEDLPQHLRYPDRANPLQASLTSLGSLPQTEYGIGEGDLLDLSVAINLERDGIKNYSLQVGENGAITVPQLGPITVQGLRPEAAASEIQRSLIAGNIYNNPVVTVSVAKQRVVSVRVIGAVEKEAVVDLPRNSADLLGALSKAGGITEDATGQIEILSPGLAAQSADLNSDYANRGNANGVHQASYEPSAPQAALAPVTINLTRLDPSSARKYPLGDGAIVMVQKRDSTPISVQGLVNKPTTFSLTGNGIRVREAISRAGGVSNQFANKVVVTRQLKGSGPPLVIPLLLTDAKSSNQSNILLAPGDSVSVEQTPFTIFGDALRVIRFGVSSNLTRFL